MEDGEKKTRTVLSGLPLRRCLHRARMCFMALCAAGLVAGALLCPESAMAQGESAQSVALNPESGLVVTPYVSLETLYDSNIFASSSQRQSDTILRLSPGIGLGYRSNRSTFNLLYTFDAEKYFRHSDLNTWQARQAGLVGGTYDFTERFTGGLSANYLKTYYPGELTPVSGVELARTRATRISVRPTATYQFDPRTSATFFYDRAREHVDTGLTTYITTGSAALIRELTRRDQLMLQYRMYWYDFTTGGSPLSRVFSVGWVHYLSKESSIFITAGPRNTDGHTVAEVNAGIRHGSERASQAFSYTRSQVTLAGRSGLYDTHAWVAAFTFRPVPQWSIDLNPGYYRVSLGDQEAKVYRFGAAARYWFARDWSVALSYSYSRQRGRFSLGGSDELILRNVISLSLTWALPTGPGHAMLPTRQGYGVPSNGTAGDGYR